MTALLVFCCGAIYEACCVGWLHYSERGRPFIAALFAMSYAIAQLTGLVDSVKDIYIAPFFVLGYGVGTFLAVWIKKKLRDKAEKDK